MVKVRLSPPDAMRREIEKHGGKWWSRGGSYGSFSEAIEDARSVAAETNFPVQVTYMGKSMTVYPKSIGY